MLPKSAHFCLKIKYLFLECVNELVGGQTGPLKHLKHGKSIEKSDISGTLMSRMGVVAHPRSDPQLRRP